MFTSSNYTKCEGDCESLNYDEGSEHHFSTF